MNLTRVDLIIIGSIAAIILLPLLTGYFGFGRPGQRHPWLKKALIAMTAIQLLVLLYFGWTFATTERQVNHAKWIAPLIFVDVLMWVCFGVGFAVAALRDRIKAKA
jgi:hypothetical protein